MFSGCIGQADSKGLNLEVVTKRLLHQQVKIPGSFGAMLHMKCVPTAISGGLDIYNICVLSEGKKKYFKDWYLMNSQHTFLFLTHFNPTNYGHIIKRM